MFKVVWVNYEGDRCEKRGFKNPDEARKWIASRRWGKYEFPTVFHEQVMRSWL